MLFWISGHIFVGMLYNVQIIQKCSTRNIMHVNIIVLELPASYAGSSITWIEWGKTTGMTFFVCKISLMSEVDTLYQCDKHRVNILQRAPRHDHDTKGTCPNLISMCSQSIWSLDSLCHGHQFWHNRRIITRFQIIQARRTKNQCLPLHSLQ